MPRISNLLQTLIQAALGMVRWSQMVPMVVAWGFVLVSVILVLFLGFQQESIGILVWLHEKTAGVPGLHAWLNGYFNDLGAVSESGGIRLTDKDLTPLFINGWLILSIALWCSSALWHLVRGTKQTRQQPLPRKLGIATLLVVVTIGIGAYGLSVAGAGEDITAADAALTLGIAATLLWLVTLYGLTIGHVVGLIQSKLESNPSERARIC